MVVAIMAGLLAGPQPISPSQAHFLSWASPTAPDLPHTGAAAGPTTPSPIAGSFPKGVVLMTHGLNNAPAALDDWRDLFNGLGYEVLRVSLRGHGSNTASADGLLDSSLDAFARVGEDDWLAEVRAGYAHSSARAAECGRPHLFFGFSLGGLLGLRLVQSGEATFDRVIAVAPAIRLHRWVELGRFMPRWMGHIRSAAAEKWRSNPATPASAYQAFFSLYRSFVAGGLPPSLRRVPVTVFIDPQDELVSAARLRQLIDREALGSWRIYGIHKTGPSRGLHRHHLAVAEQVIGSPTWAAIAEVVRTELARAPLVPGL